MKRPLKIKFLEKRCICFDRVCYIMTENGVKECSEDYAGYCPVIKIKDE